MHSELVLSKLVFPEQVRLEFADQELVSGEPVPIKPVLCELDRAKPARWEP